VRTAGQAIPESAPLRAFVARWICLRLRSGRRSDSGVHQAGEVHQRIFRGKQHADKGSVGSIDFSPDPQQKYLFVSDIMNNVVWILNRNDGSVAGRFGGMGHSGGLFHWLNVATMDSRGNVYTGEVETGKRVQKFVPTN